MARFEFDGEQSFPIKIGKDAYAHVPVNRGGEVIDLFATRAEAQQKAANWNKHLLKPGEERFTVGKKTIEVGDDYMSKIYGQIKHGKQDGLHSLQFVLK